MRVRGTVTDKQFCSNLVIGQALRNKTQNFNLAPGEQQLILLAEAFAKGVFAKPIFATAGYGSNSCT